MVHHHKIQRILALAILAAMLVYSLAPVALAASPRVPEHPGRAEAKPESLPALDPPEAAENLLASYDCAGQTEIPQAECEALVALYNATNGGSWTDQNNWLQSNTPSGWYGVAVLDGHVVRLQLPWNNLVGTLPGELGDLSELQILELQANALSGGIPVALGNLTNLTVLNLSFNALSGGIPGELGNLTNLKDLYLSSNDLSGELPDQLGNLAAIKNLVLPDNQVSGPIPATLTGLADLFFLDLSNNQLSGAIPDALGANPGLAWLGLASNQLSGGIPSVLGGLSALVHLDLSSNGLSGAIPTNLTSATSLQELDLSGNALTGGIPASLGTLTSLTDLSLGSNPLGGSIPAELGGLIGLETLDLSNCALSGPVPAALGGLLYLQTLSLSNNSLSGAIPAVLGGLLRVETLNLSRNQLSGTIPEALGGMLSLQNLNLSYNLLTGSVLPALGDVTTLRNLDLSHNQLSGELPDMWAKLLSLDELRLNHNALSGAIPAGLGALDSVEWLALDHNQFNGAIPASLGGMGSLYDLNLSANRLTGALPVELGSLRNLYRLSLHSNALQAPIPQSLTSLTNLGSADLGYNRLATTDTGLREFLAAKDPDWEATQTVPPSNLRVTDVGMDRFTLAWTPMLYTTDGGNYQVSLATTPGGPYTLYGNTASKLATGIEVTGLLPTNTYYAVVRSYTPAHDDQATALLSDYTVEAAATTTLTGTFDCANVVEVPCSECEALEALYVATNGANWSQRENWQQTTLISAWAGVSVTDGHVTALTLPSNGLSGALPPEIGDLTGLTALYLGYNAITGELPASLGSLSQLAMIDLRQNQLTGALPAEIGSLTNLQTLLLQGNQLSGAIPAALGGATSLTSLNLSGNDLSGELPASLGSLSALATLLLNSNSFSGAVPAELGNLSNLITLSLSHNALSGDLPATLVNLTSLGSQWWAAVDLGYNGLTVSDTGAGAFLDQKDPDWRATQTVKPTDLAVDTAYSRSVRLSWTPIAYQGDAGRYEVSLATQAGGPWTVHGATLSKAMATYVVDGLEPTTDYWFKVRTATGPHDVQTNELWSQATDSVSATTESERPQAFQAPSGWILGYGVVAGGWFSQNVFPRTLADVNGDGMDDIVAFGNRATYVSLSNGQRFGGPVPWTYGFGVAAGGWFQQNVSPRTLGDVNGDGMADIVAFGNGATYVALSTGSGFGATSAWLGYYGVYAGGWTEQNLMPRTVGDVNGDGLADVVGFHPRGVMVALSDGQRFGPPTMWIEAYGLQTGGWPEQNLTPRFLGDVNGDGLQDVVGFGDSGTYVSLSTGLSFGPMTRWVANFGRSAGGWSEQNIFPRMLGDVNGDGRDDIVGCGNRATYVSLSNGSGFGPVLPAVNNFGVLAGGWPTQDLFPRVTGDVDGDGQDDLMGFGNRASYVSLADW